MVRVQRHASAQGPYAQLLLRLLKALSMERESDQAADRHAHPNYAQYNAEAELFTGEGKGEGKGGGIGKGKG